MAEEMLRLVQEITMKKTPEEAMKLMIREYLEKKIAECKEEIEKFQRKYGMDFKEYERRLGREFSLSYEHEMDYARWGARLDELEDLEQHLGQLK
jgi:transposase